MSTPQSSFDCASSKSCAAVNNASCSFAPKSNDGWLTALTAVAMVGSASVGGQPQGPPLTPALMHVPGGAQAVAAAAALVPAARLPRFKNLVSEFRRYANALYGGH